MLLDRYWELVLLTRCSNLQALCCSQVLSAGLRLPTHIWPLTWLSHISCLISGGHQSFFFGHWDCCFRLLAMSAQSFKPRMEPYLACFITCMQWVSQIHLWCDTYWTHDSSHCSRAFLIHILIFIKGFRFSRSISNSKRKEHKLWALAIQTSSFLSVNVCFLTKIKKTIEIFFKISNVGSEPDWIFKIAKEGHDHLKVCIISKIERTFRGKCVDDNQFYHDCSFPHVTVFFLCTWCTST